MPTKNPPTRHSKWLWFHSFSARCWGGSRTPFHFLLLQHFIQVCFEILRRPGHQWNEGEKEISVFACFVEVRYFDLTEFGLDGSFIQSVYFVRKTTDCFPVLLSNFGKMVSSGNTNTNIITRFLLLLLNILLNIEELNWGARVIRKTWSILSWLNRTRHLCSSLLRRNAKIAPHRATSTIQRSAVNSLFLRYWEQRLRMGATMKSHLCSQAWIWTKDLFIHLINTNKIPIVIILSTR